MASDVIAPCHLLRLSLDLLVACQAKFPSVEIDAARGPPTVQMLDTVPRMKLVPVILLILATCGCGRHEVSHPPDPAIANTPSPQQQEPGENATAALVTELASLGYTTKRAGKGEAVVCGTRGCVCLAELACEGPCITLQDNLAAFKEALARTSGNTVSCELADTGKLCGLSYFRFEGDIYRLETRYFGADGRLIGQRNTTDYNEYCNGASHVRFEGAVPSCPSGPRDVTVICTDHQHDRAVRDPRGDLMGFLGEPKRK